MPTGGPGHRVERSGPNGPTTLGFAEPAAAFCGVEGRALAPTSCALCLDIGTCAPAAGRCGYPAALTPDNEQLLLPIASTAPSRRWRWTQARAHNRPTPQDIEPTTRPRQPMSRDDNDAEATVDSLDEDALAKETIDDIDLEPPEEELEAEELGIGGIEVLEIDEVVLGDLPFDDSRKICPRLVKSPLAFSPPTTRTTTTTRTRNSRPTLERSSRSGLRPRMTMKSPLAFSPPTTRTTTTILSTAARGRCAARWLVFFVGGGCWFGVKLRGRGTRGRPWRDPQGAACVRG